MLTGGVVLTGGAGFTGPALLTDGVMAAVLPDPPPPQATQRVINTLAPSDFGTVVCIPELRSGHPVSLAC